MKRFFLAILIVLTVATASFAINLAWNDDPSWTTSGVIGIRIYFENTATGAVRYADVPYPNTMTTIPDANFQRGITYDFWATAFNNVNESGPSNIVTSLFGWDGIWGSNGGTAPTPVSPVLRLSTQSGGYQIPASSITNAE